MLVVVMMAGLAWGSVRPLPGDTVVARSDKTAHAVAYGAFAAVLVLALRTRRGWGAGRVAAIAFAWAAGYGAAMEVAQSFVGRLCDVLDALANAAGAGLVALLWLCVAAWRRRRRRAVEGP